MDLFCLLKRENIDRRFCIAIGELGGTGDDGGLDRCGSSEKIVASSFGLEVNGSDELHTEEAT